MTRGVLVSIIIPCYNAEAWVRKAIDSCLGQIYHPIEIIVVDDGSADASMEILQSYGTMIRGETGRHLGGNHVRNRGFNLSTGDYIQFLDADDFVLPEKIAHQVSFLEATGADAVYGDWRHQFDRLDGSSFMGDVQIGGVQEDVLESVLSGWWVAPVSFLFRRKTVISCGGWDEGLQAGQDRDFLISVAMTGADIRYQRDCLSIYRRHGHVTVSTGNRLRWLENHQRVLEKAEAKLAAAGRLSIRYQEALSKSFFHLARNYYDIDSSKHALLLQKTVSLCPDFRPHESAVYNLTWRLFGVAVAEKLAGLKRQALRKTHRELS